MSMYSSRMELVNDLEMIGSLLEQSVKLDIIGTAAISLVANIDCVIGDIDSITPIPQDIEWLGAFISDASKELNINNDGLKTEFAFGNLIIQTPSLDFLVESKLDRSATKDIEFLKENHLI